ncbi:Bacterial capsule synthesis protein PGA_cap [Variovorax sp. PBS-H4]|uniref:CapA family protein n=1 Tax=Variovorax sp. PBS-H4 TaxID=434008 RepID=UPI0013177AA5|nr:CapA family protein [Variovorax sp. PBS-H4]VTU22321.1 Bacterial capsule synthesis protein PGA_cap [Variovorax sp. PBS-H4]
MADTLTLRAVGDLYIGKPLESEADTAFLAAVNTLRSADARFGNLEFQLLRQGMAGAHAAPGAWAGAPQAAADQVVWLGLDAVSTANNHAGDYGEAGQASTEEALQVRRIAWCGTGPDLAAAQAPAFVDTPKGRVAFVAVSSSYVAHARAGKARGEAPGRRGLAPLRFGTRYRIDAESYAALQRITEQLPLEHLAGHRERPLARRYDAERGQGLEFFGSEFSCGETFGVESWAAPDDLSDLVESVRAAKREADWVVASLHSHEYDERPDRPAAFAVQACTQAIEAGADAVIGHGAHGVRGIQIHRGRPIFYGVGAFVFQPYLFPSQPSDFYEAYAMGDASLREAYRVRKERAGFFAKRHYWEAMLVQLEFTRDAAPQFEVSPIVLWNADAAEPDGLPRLAHNEDGIALLRKIQRLSTELGAALALDSTRFVLRNTSTQP